MFLYGPHSVRQRLQDNPRSIKKIFLEQGFDNKLILDLIKAKHLSSSYLSRNQLNKIKRADNLQGIIAEVENFRYGSLDELLQYPKSKQLSLLFLDRVYDPHNLGSIIRTAACFGGFAVIIPKHKACEVTETVLHVACGAENFVPVAMVTNLADGLRKAKDAGYWIAGSVVSGGQDIRKVSLPFPIAFVMGSEGEGIRPGIDKLLELKLTIPMQGAPLSLNVHIAAAVFCYEITRQRG